MQGVLARIKGDMLTFESIDLGEKACEEIVISAVAMMEVARRAGGRRDVADLGGFNAAIDVGMVDTRRR